MWYSKRVCVEDPGVFLPEINICTVPGAPCATRVFYFRTACLFSGTNININIFKHSFKIKNTNNNSPS